MVAHFVVGMVAVLAAAGGVLVAAYVVAAVAAEIERRKELRR